PVELFLDPAIPFPRLRVASTLLRRKLGFRALMDVIPLDPTLVKGSHGACPRDSADWPVLIGTGGGGELEATDVHARLLEACS
ncbi:MAG: alkaline phosphatase family protein, partial [Opitutaceae bacterium]